MEPGQSSRTKEDDNVWAKLVPIDSGHPEVEIRSLDGVVCSETEDSSSEKHKWCKITRTDRLSATITNLSSHGIIVDGTVVKEETLHIKGGSEIISGPDRKGYLSFTFELMPSGEHDRQNVKIFLDVEHAKCSICLNIWHDVVTVAPCLHNFCNGCFSEWLKRSSTQSPGKHKTVVCPQCRATVNSVGRNHFLHNIEEAILQAFSSLRRSNEEIASLDKNASIKPTLVLGMPKSKSRKRALSVSSDEGNAMNLQCPQCDTEVGGFRCSRTTAHILCQGCGGLMPSRPNIGVPQQCFGCDRAFCGAYWRAQFVNASDAHVICSPETFKQISEHTISRIPDTVHENNRYEREITEKCIQQTGTPLQSLISEWITKFDSRQIDRSRLQINHADTITARNHLCTGCFNKLVDFLLYWYRITIHRHLLPQDVAERQDCWYGYLCRTQHHSPEHARKRNHVCRPTRGQIHEL